MQPVLCKYFDSGLATPDSITSEQLAKLILQLRTAQIFCNNLTVRVYQVVLWDGRYPVHLGSFIIPKLEIAYMCPRKLIIFDRLNPWVA